MIFRRNEKGAIAVIVAVLFGFGVMTAAAALSIDVGNINTNRRQLQNGADAVALAAAKQCVTTGVCPNASDTGLIALENANANPNAAAGVSGIRRVDGATPICGVGGSLPACATSPSTGNLQECPQPVPAGTNYIRVYTQTTNAAGTHLLPYSFGAAIAGGGKGANQQTCASVAWGPAIPPAPFPVTFSQCEYTSAASNHFAPPAGATPGYGATGNAAGNTIWPTAAVEVVLETAKKSPNCTSWNGHVAPGSFGTIDNLACHATVDSGGWIQGDAGNSTPCSDSELHAMLGTIVYIPIYDCFTGTKGSFANCTNGKNHDWFHMTGYAPFYLTGFYFSGSGSAGNSIFPPDGGAKPCSGGSRCISGWFTTDTLDTTIDTSGAPSFGSLAIQLAG